MQTIHDSRNSSVRVPVALLDSLMNLAGELVLGRNQLLQAIVREDKQLIETTSQHIDMVTTEIQEKILQTRMQPLGTVFDKLPRVARDLAQKSGKQVDLSFTGETVELDKTIMEAIENPLIWLIQKAVSRGVESPEERIKIKKPIQSVIELKACHEAGQVNIDIIDDGKGIDPDTIVRQAIEKGLISENQGVQAIADSEKMGLVFQPGLFADQQESSNGSQFAGIDEIKACLEKVGGIINVHSRLGQGTKVRIKLPLTLSIIPSQIIKLGDERFAVPQANLSELLRIPANQVKHKIEKVGRAAVIRLRGELLPLIDLAGVFGYARSFGHPEDGQRYPERRQHIFDRRSKDHSVVETEFEGMERRMDQDRRYHAESAVNIAVVSAANYKYGLVVDGLNDSEEIVVKPLGKHLKDCHGFAGATIMGDGKVALILDVASIGEMSQLKSQSNSKHSEQIKSSVTAQGTESSSLESLLFFNNSETERFAVPLDRVARIEKVEATRIEVIGGTRVLKYRGGSLPLLALQDTMRVNPLPQKSHYQVICFIINGKEIGLLATPPVDAAEVKMVLDTRTLKQPGVLGSAVLMDKTTLILDIHQVVQNVKPDFFKEGNTFLSI